MLQKIFITDLVIQSENVNNEWKQQAVEFCTTKLRAVNIVPIGT